jgi:sugar lactone lactonase YvrE
MRMGRNAAISGLLACLWGIGFVLMGFEMLGSRYLNPYFGGGITTWACLISIVLFAMMVGYFAGGYAVDARPGVGLLIGCVLLAGISVLFVPVLADKTLQSILSLFGDGFWGVLIASFCLSFVPVALLSACSPFVVRLLLVDLKAGGRTAGLVYSVSTLGNVAGTLVTTFYLIPNFGTRTITMTFGFALLALAALLYISRVTLEKGLSAKAISAAVLCAYLVIGIQSPVSRAEDPARTSWDASYPEGPIWLGSRLLYAEMAADRVMEWVDGRRGVFWSERGCGPTAIAPFRGSEFIVLCHLDRKIVHLDHSAKKLVEYRLAENQEPFQDPNDCFTDGKGGVFFTDPGIFRSGSPATGKVFHISPEGRIRKLVDGLKYTNGIAVDFEKKRLLVSEHLGRKVWMYDLREDLSIANRRLFLDVERYLTPAEIVNYPETGPDGIELDPDGNVFIAIYGASRIMVVMATGQVARISVPMQFVTNIAASTSRVVIVGSFANDRPPFAGKVQIVSRRELLDEARQNVVAPLR